MIGQEEHPESNFHENWRPMEMMRSGGESVQELVQRLERDL
jgi:hypothetical protein